mmetsp:Transcript_23792/g.69690  ORF Transcript_23792/g.69690 Transcript_23792/m.69690 type:complete len:279 (+) Transcript_23792:1008-1844(+)
MGAKGHDLGVHTGHELYVELPLSRHHGLAELDVHGHPFLKPISGHWEVQILKLNATLSPAHLELFEPQTQVLSNGLLQPSKGIPNIHLDAAARPLAWGCHLVGRHLIKKLGQGTGRSWGGDGRGCGGRVFRFGEVDGDHMDQGVEIPHQGPRGSLRLALVPGAGRFPRHFGMYRVTGGESQVNKGLRLVGKGVRLGTAGEMDQVKISGIQSEFLARCGAQVADCAGSRHSQGQGCRELLRLGVEEQHGEREAILQVLFKLAILIPHFEAQRPAKSVIR